MFIELHLESTGKPVLVNVEQIQTITVLAQHTIDKGVIEGTDATTIRLASATVRVKETIQDLAKTFGVRGIKQQ